MSTEVENKRGTAAVTPEKLALAQQAFERFHTRCFWFMREDLRVYDAATNKMLALMARSEPRDYLDIVFFHQRRLSLGALCWAAAGKDPGVNPFMILQEAQRNAHFRPEQFRELKLAVPLDLPGWKKIWIEASHQAEWLLDKLPADEVGCLYLDAQNCPVTPDPASPEFPKLHRHFGSVRGAWPVVSA